MISSNGIVKKIRLGDDIPSKCGRCKDERLHQVVALGNGGVPERVICKTCGSEHKHRSPNAASNGAGTRRTSTRSTRRSAEVEVPFQGSAVNYSPKDVYELGTYISHPKFGTGKIIDVRQGKIDVKFGSELRTLLHAG
jgi:hypothetical protein